MKNILKLFKHNIIHNFLLILILIFTAIIFFNNLSQTPLDIDELFTLNILYLNNLSDLINLGSIFDNHPPLYLLIMYFFTKIFGLSEYMVRVPSVIFSIISFYLIFVLGKKIHSVTYGFTSLIITAILIPKPWIAFYARGYVLLLLFSILTMINLVNIIHFKTKNPNKETSISMLFYFVLSSFLCIYTHYFGCILIFCELLFLFIFFHKNIIKEFIVIVASLTSLFAPWLFIIHLKQVCSIPPVFTEWLKWNVFNNYNVYWLLAIIITGIICFCYNLKTYSKEKKIYFCLILYLFIFPFLLTTFIDKFVIKCYLHKYLIISLVPFYLLISNTFVLLLKNKVSLFLTLIIFYLLSAQQIIPPDAFTEHNIKFVINNHNRVNRPIVIIDKHMMFAKYHKYHFDKYANPYNITFINDFDKDKLIEKINNVVNENNNQYIWLIDATTIYDINQISDDKSIVEINKSLPSIYLVK